MGPFAMLAERLPVVCRKDNHALCKLSGSVDGLVCELDATVNEEDDAVFGIHNTGAPVSHLGFYGAPSGPSTHSHSSSSVTHSRFV